MGCFGDLDFPISWACAYHRCNCVDECRALKARNRRLLAIEIPSEIMNLSESMGKARRDRAIRMRNRAYVPGITGYNNDWKGALGELMIAKMFPDLTSHLQLYDDTYQPPSPDFINKDGATIDVKCTSYPADGIMYSTFPINVREHQHGASKHELIFFSCINNRETGKATHWTFLGWMPSEQIAKYPIEDPGYGPAYMVSVKDMRTLVYSPTFPL